MAQEFNIPDKDDPEFNSKVGTLIRSLYDLIDKPSKNFSPIKDPLDGNQVGDVYFDQVSGKLKVVTEGGTQIIKFE